eukprot:3947929-Ditylum_brightwellii.AAC.1
MGKQQTLWKSNVAEKKRTTVAKNKQKMTCWLIPKKVMTSSPETTSEVSGLSQWLGEKEGNIEKIERNIISEIVRYGSFDAKRKAKKDEHMKAFEDAYN